MIHQETGKWLMIAGLALLGIGAIAYLFGDKLHFLGRLPGDIIIERDNFTMYIPVMTMILLSVVASILIRLLAMLK